MAAKLNDDEYNLAITLLPGDIPAKLRCGLCNLVAVNAVKLPCCETSICDKCQAGLPEQCTICEHQPLSPDVCTAMKSLRMTIKAHLKTELKRRTAQATNGSATPADVAPTPTPAPAPAEAASLPQEASAPETEPTHEEDAKYTASEATVEAANDEGAVAPSIEQEDHTQGDVPAEGNGETTEEHQTEEGVDDEDTGDKSDVEIITERPETEMDQSNGEQFGSGDNAQPQQEQDTTQANAQQGFGFNQNQQGFGNMDFNANGMNGFNPMMAMQNGMMPGFAMGMPNMMGMNGMPMDPSMMMGNNNFGGMGDMNNMNMMASMMNAGGFGAGMPGMGINQGFGMNGGGGYNRVGNHYNQQPFHPNARGFNRPYGRGFRGGRGGYGFGGRGGRGGFNQFGPGAGFNQGFQNGMPNGMNQYQQQQGFNGQQQDQQQPSGETELAEPGAGRGSPSYDAMKTTNGEPGDANVEARPSGAEGEATNETGGEDTNAGEGGNGEATNGEGELDHADEHTSESIKHSQDDEISRHSPNSRAPSSGLADADEDGFTDSNNIAQGNFNNPNADFYQNQQFGYNEFDQSAGFHGHVGFGGHMNGGGDMPGPAPPVNAPTGPKAMRAGLPNSGWYSRPQVSQVVSNANVHASVEPSQRGQGSVRGRSEQRDNQDGEREKEASRSRSRHRSRKDRHRGQEDDYESDATYERRKEKERRKRKERERRDEDRDAGRSNGRARSRSATPNDDSSRRRRHRDDDSNNKRSRRDRSRDGDKRRGGGGHRDRSADANGDADSRRSKAGRSSRRDRDEEDDYSRDKDRSRRSSRRRHDEPPSRSSKHSRRSSRDRGGARGAVEQASEDIGFKIKGSHSNRRGGGGMPPPAGNSHSSRRGSEATTNAAASDPYAAERERHKQERAAKEQQRRQSSHGLGKRGREDEDVGGDDGGRSKKRDGRSRKISAKYEGEIGDGEREREMGRWR